MAAEKHRPGLLDHVYAWRDRLLTSHRFQRFAARFPLTRPIARRKARTLFDLCTGFVYTQVLLACVRLGLFDQLRAGPLALGEIAKRLSLSTDAAERLLLAACSLDLVARRGRDRFGLGELGAAYLGNPGLGAMIEHHALLYADLHDPVALLRGERPATELSRYWAYSGNDEAGELEGEHVADYSRLMAATQPMIAAEVLDAYAVGKHRVLMDVGGGEGAFLIKAAERAPDLQLMLFDLPAVAERARQRFQETGLGDRARAIGGDFQSGVLPKDADLISLVRIIHDHDDDAALTILKAVRAALPPGGTLLIAEPMAGTAGAEAMADAYFGFYLLAMGRGRARRQDEIFALLHAAGFDGMKAIPTSTPLLTRVIWATVNTN
ncbi:MAG: methyltransferase [Pseudomonadota bacterium]